MRDERLGHLAKYFCSLCFKNTKLLDPGYFNPPSIQIKITPFKSLIAQSKARHEAGFLCGR